MKQIDRSAMAESWAVAYLIGAKRLSYPQAKRRLMETDGNWALLIRETASNPQRRWFAKSFA